MTSPARRDLTRSTGVMTAAFAVLFFCASKVGAECGDYVIIGTTAEEHLAANGGNPSGPTHDPWKPCHGPSCSAQPFTPVEALAPNPPSIVKLQRGDLFASSKPPHPSDGSWALPDNAGVLPVRLPAFIYRPPR